MLLRSRSRTSRTDLLFNPYSFTAYSIGKIGVKTAQNSIHFALITQKCSNTNGYSNFGFQTKILFCLILYAKAAIAPNVYPVVYSLDDAAAACATCLCALRPCRCTMMCPCRRANTQAGRCNPPPGVLAWVGGGWHGVARVWDSYIYLNLYTSFHIAFLIIGK